MLGRIRLPALPGAVKEAGAIRRPLDVVNRPGRIASFAQASDAEAAARFLTAPLAEITESLASEDGAPLFGELTGNVGAVDRARGRLGRWFGSRSD